MTENNQQAQIVATIGPESGDINTLNELVSSGLGVARLNLSWGTLAEHKDYIENIRSVSDDSDRRIPVIADLPGPRQKEQGGHNRQR